MLRADFQRNATAPGMKGYLPRLGGAATCPSGVGGGGQRMVEQLFYPCAALHQHTFVEHVGRQLMRCRFVLELSASENADSLPRCQKTRWAVHASCLLLWNVLMLLRCIMKEIYGSRNFDAHLQDKQSTGVARQVIVVDGCVPIADYGSDTCKDIAFVFLTRWNCCVAFPS